MKEPVTKLVNCLLVVWLSLLLFSSASSAQNFKITNLTADTSGVAKNTDPNLINPIGLARGITGPWWSTNNGSATSTLYNGVGVSPGLVVTIPSAPNVKVPVLPTSIVFSGDSGVIVSTGNPALFLFATQQGTILGWPGVGEDFTTASILINRNTKASYTGLTIAEIGGAYYVYAVNALSGKIEVYDSNMQPVQLKAGAFVDPDLPASMVPFNIQDIGQDVFVTYQPSQIGRGAPGWVSVFGSTGQFLTRLQKGPWLDAPWGVTLAPQDFGQFAHTLLVANHGTGNIAAFDLFTHQFIGFLLDSTGIAISIDGLWALDFADGGIADWPSGVNSDGAATGHFNACYFTSGPQMGQHGLFGVLVPLKSEQNNLHE